MLGKRSDPVAQVAAGNGGKLLHPHDPCCPVNLDRWRKAGQRRMAFGRAQRRTDAGCIDPDQVGLKIDDRRGPDPNR